MVTRKVEQSGGANPQTSEQIGVTSLHRFSAADPMIGTRIGHLRVTGVLGSGGMGEVYRAHDERLNRTVALKVIRAERRLSVDARARFLREARTLSALDHPNICRIHEYIEAEEGDFLVLELIDGVTLEMAIELGMNRQRKLRIAIEICDALAAAHRKGIVHRDLKEENVMIAANGAAKILDFGISRRAEERETMPPSFVGMPIEKATTLVFPVGGVSLTPPDQLPRPVTEQGVAVGTPAMMSPEQAVGEMATAASDMYSFGLLLQVLFTEKPAHPQHLSARELMMRAAAGTTEPMTGQPRDITHLVERLKQKAPADRPTANETLQILKNIEGRPKRRAQLAMLLTLIVLLAGFAVKYVADVTAARRAAEAKRRQAEALATFIVGDLWTKLEAVGRLDVLDGAASRALAYYESVDPEELSESDLRQNALALAQLGRVRVDEGKLDEAAKMFAESMRFASVAVERNPKNDDARLALSNAHFYLGDALRRKGDPEGTLRHFRSYLEISRQLAASHPGDAKYDAEVSYGHGNVGAAYEAAGNLNGALVEYRTAVDLDRRRLQRDPRNEKWQRDLATSLNRLGVIQQTRGELVDARKAFVEELSLHRRLVAAAPNDAKRISRLAVSLAYTGVLQQMMGDEREALASFDEELALTTDLEERDRSNVAALRNRAAAQTRLAMLIEDLPRARTMSDAAERDLRDVVRIEARPAWRRDLAVAIARAGTVRIRGNDRRGASERAREALAILEQVAAAEPRSPQTTRALCEVLLFAAVAAEPDSMEAARYRYRAAALERGGDLRVMAMQAEALILLGRRTEAAPLIADLTAARFRDRRFITLIDPQPKGERP